MKRGDFFRYDTTRRFLDRNVQKFDLATESIVRSGVRCVKEQAKSNNDQVIAFLFF
jgi:hypothetical protein